MHKTTNELLGFVFSNTKAKDKKRNEKIRGSGGASIGKFGDGKIENLLKTKINKASGKDSYL